MGQFSSKLEAEQELLRQVAKAEHKEEKRVDKYSNHYGCQAFFLGASFAGTQQSHPGGLHQLVSELAGCITSP